MTIKNQLEQVTRRVMVLAVHLVDEKEHPCKIENEALGELLDLIVEVLVEADSQHFKKERLNDAV
ncbi:MAG: hypothetical protein EXR74_02255 [Bdellovibrionales bacterium]|nr:hypothetical protein [Bdellovibrionales bacterium]